MRCVYSFFLFSFGNILFASIYLCTACIVDHLKPLGVLYLTCFTRRVIYFFCKDICNWKDIKKMTKSVYTNKNCQEICKYFKVVLYLSNNKKYHLILEQNAYLIHLSWCYVLFCIANGMINLVKSEKAEKLSGVKLFPTGWALWIRSWYRIANLFRSTYRPKRGVTPIPW